MTRRKIVSIFIILFCVLNAGLAAAAAVNPDKPLKGRWDFKPEQVWDVFSANEDILVNVRAIRVDETGNVYALDRKHFKFFVFSPEGKFLYSFGKKGEGPGEFKMAGSFFLVGKYLILSDMGTLHYFTRDGKHVKSVKTGGFHFAGAWLDENRFVYTKEMEEDKKKINRLQVFDTRDKSKTTIASLESGKDMVATSGGMTLVVKIGDATPMIVLAADEEGKHLYYGKNDKYTIYKTSIDGKELMSFSIEDRERKSISDDTKRKQFENITLNGGKMPEEMIKKLMKTMPDYMTHFIGIRIDDSGLIYVSLTDMNNKTGRAYDIFSPDGKYLYHADLKLPEGLKTHGGIIFKGNYIYVFAEDEEGERKLVKYKISKPTL
jgi:hypothetical protein